MLDVFVHNPSKTFKPLVNQGLFYALPDACTMTVSLKKVFFVVAMLCYVPVCLNVSASTVDSMLTAVQGGSEIPICGCEDSSCCCGSPCCVPKEEAASELSCCDSPEPAPPSHDEIPLSTQLAWKASCTCGGDHAALGFWSADPHTFAHCLETAFWILGLSRNSSYDRNWTSRQSTPLEQVPKSCLFR
jgi:hypothetical protein